ncbi:hypothetical protein F2Q68_00021567 [Brassica cretica]|uniref:Uncharacterized protein n=1 Tax=Brassica cretica TaxID=69181 RepID=A0A8S9FW40_BRACR|nr:hypothetical protein F2Q68_00021567 [Brassica cretica]
MRQLGTDHTVRLIHQYIHRDTRLRSYGPKGKYYGLSRVLLDQSEFWLDHQSWLGEWCGEDGLRFGRFDRLDVVPALAPFRTYAGRSGTRLGTDHTVRLIHQYIHRDTRLRSDGPKGKYYGLSRVLLDQSEFWLDHQSWLGEWCGEDGLRFGRFDRLDVVPALAPFRTYAGRSSTRLGQLREPRSE